MGTVSRSPQPAAAYFTPEDLDASFVANPFFSREGANVTFTGKDCQISTGGPDGREGLVYQARTELPEFDGYYPAIGAWIVGDEPADIGIREDATPIATKRSRFVTHYFE